MTATIARRRTRARTAWTCNYCKTGQCRSCPGAALLASGDLWVCQHGKQHRSPYCLLCKNERADDINPERWQCLDPHGCATRVAARNDNNPLWRMLQACRAASDLERKRKRLELERTRELIDPHVDESIERLHDNLEQREIAKAAIRKKQTAPKPPRPTSGVCQCECGGTTKGGKFVPGHDAKLASRLVAGARSGDRAAYEELVRRNWTKKMPADVRTQWENQGRV